ncbi:universal stress protein [Streptomyces sp. NPDC059994]|uniref:universal stress protein n=1 Tax=Streptomyces sp. NPDC059994 TaxID=3347029 RepID=UPI0036BD3E7A
MGAPAGLRPRPRRGRPPGHRRARAPGAGRPGGGRAALAGQVPQVRVEPRCVADHLAARLVEAAADAALLVVGRRLHGHGGLAHIGPVTHAVLHHARTPVAVVPHA